MITAQQVNDFKEVYCDENTIIPKLLKDNFSEMVEYPILDVGSGLGEISSYAFAGKNVHHLDIEDFSFHQIDPLHTREIGDFFSFSPNKKYNTILISHTLQFIDDNITILNNRIKELDPRIVVIVRNTNNDFMGEIINFFDSNNISSNPERIINEFPSGYSEHKKISFVATLKCPSFEVLVEQISYLWDMKVEGEIFEKFIHFLKENLNEPSFKINQEIVMYKKD